LTPGNGCAATLHCFLHSNCQQCSFGHDFGPTSNLMITPNADWLLVGSILLSMPR